MIQMPSELFDTSIHPTFPLFFREEQEGGGDAGLLTRDEDEADSREEHVILCKACNQVITDWQQKIVVDSSHSHTFFNPAGIVFEIGCFSNAPGCGVVGGPSREFSWFAGTTWTPAVCTGCLAHLGWLFEGRENPFFGLILSNLLESSK